MRSLTIIILLSVLAVFSACRPSAAPVSISEKPVSINEVPSKDAQGRATKPLGEMSWTDFAGNVSKLKDFQGKVVILDFWATYCPPCIEEIPHLNDLQAKYGPEQLVVIGLHVGGEEDQPKVAEFVERLKIAYTLAYPEDALTAFVFGQESAIPQTVVFDKQGNVELKIAGFSDKIKLQLDQAVEKAINDGKVTQ